MPWRFCRPCRPPPLLASAARAEVTRFETLATDASGFEGRRFGEGGTATKTPEAYPAPVRDAAEQLRAAGLLLPEDASEAVAAARDGRLARLPAP